MTEDPEDRLSERLEIQIKTAYNTTREPVPINRFEVPNAVVQKHGMVVAHQPRDWQNNNVDLNMDLGFHSTRVPTKAMVSNRT